MTEFLLGLLSGVFASASVWYFVNHTLRPNIIWADCLSRIQWPLDSGGFEHQVSFKNKGKRNLVDCRINCTICIPNKFGHDNARLSENVSKYDLFINEYIFEVRSGHSVRKNFSTREYSIEEKLGTRLGDKCIQEMLQRLPGSYLVFHLLATDAFTKSKHVFQSPKYDASSFQNGRYIENRLKIEHP